MFGMNCRCGPVRDGAPATHARIFLTLAIAGLMLAGCRRNEGTGRASGSGQSELVVESSAFKPLEVLPTQYTADGANISPPLNWSSVPQGTKEFAVVVEDRDAPERGTNNGRWTHWILCKIPADATQLAENRGHQSPLSSPAGAVQGRNSWGDAFYRGPDPAKGSGMHHYLFRVYALDAPIAAQVSLDRAALDQAMEGHILSRGETVALYGR